MLAGHGHLAARSPQAGRAFPCGVCIFSPCMHGFPLKSMCYIYIQSVLMPFCFSVVLLFMIQHPVLRVLECASLDLDLVSRCCTAAAHCSAEEDGGQMQGTNSPLHHVCVTHKVYCVIISSLKSHKILNIQIHTKYRKDNNTVARESEIFSLRRKKIHPDQH